MPWGANEEKHDGRDPEIPIASAGFGWSLFVVAVFAQHPSGAGNPMPDEEAAMTALRRYLIALRMAVATFWHFSRPPRELEIIEESPAETTPQAIGDDALDQQAPPRGDLIDWYGALTEQPDGRPVFYLMAFHQAADGTLTWGASTELTVADIVRTTGEDPDLFLAQPSAVQDKFCDNMLAGLCPAEALLVAQVLPAAMN